MPIALQSAVQHLNLLQVAGRHHGVGQGRSCGSAPVWRACGPCSGDGQLPHIHSTAGARRRSVFGRTPLLEAGSWLYEGPGGPIPFCPLISSRPAAPLPARAFGAGGRDTTAAAAASCCLLGLVDCLSGPINQAPLPRTLSPCRGDH